MTYIRDVYEWADDVIMLLNNAPIKKRMSDNLLVLACDVKLKSSTDTPIIGSYVLYVNV